MTAIPEIDLSNPAALRDPFTAYGRAREICPLARLVTPGFGTMWAVTRYEHAKAMLTDPRFELNANSYLRPDVPEHCLKYMRTMQEMDGPEHTRLRRLVSPSFSARRAAEFRPRVMRIVEGMLDDLAEKAERAEPAGGGNGNAVDLLDHFARPLPIEVICELVGIPPEDRGSWRTYGAAVTAGHGPAFARAIPAIMRDAVAAVARRTHEPGADLLSELVGVHADDQDRLGDTELVTLVWHLILAGQTPANLVANAVETLLGHPGQLAALRADEDLMPGAVEELTRWYGPQLLTLPRYAREDADIAGFPIGKGEPVTVALAAANRDPRVFADPDRFDLRRPAGKPAHLGYAHGPHFCLGAALARVQTEAALTGLLRRFPDLAFAGDGAQRAPDPGTWRLTALPVSLCPVSL
ncbi:cytochrome P450 family protein [Actinopolymorpha rutila]|uniref:Cytochrome P450 n=1 Tax=Actinopolymorpha rutila TaxID=446787 RepID=A0A852ZIK7_9ACTN|nr:cytochrome P450 [Actinopolymorpha rutila]NYH91965.1 cytochrome P450 [Actinopolymorpha rutila]